jgi:hypothetical protein
VIRIILGPTSIFKGRRSSQKTRKGLELSIMPCIGIGLLKQWRATYLFQVTSLSLKAMLRCVSRYAYKIRRRLTGSPHPSTQATPSHSPLSSIANYIYLPFGSAMRKLSAPHDYVWGDQVGSQGAQTRPPSAPKCILHASASGSNSAPTPSSALPIRSSAN